MELKISDSGINFTLVDANLLTSLTPTSKYKIEITIKEANAMIGLFLGDLESYLEEQLFNVKYKLKQAVRRFGKLIKKSIKWKKGSLRIEVNGEILTYLFLDLNESLNFYLLSEDDEYIPIDDYWVLPKLDCVFSERKPRILVVGPTGTGKSNMLKYCFDLDTKPKTDLLGVTEDIKSYNYKNVIFYDSMGLGECISGRVPNLIAIRRLINFLRINPNISLCVIVLRNSRWDELVENTIKTMRLLLSKEIPTLLLLSHTEDESLSAQYKEKLKPHFKLQDVLSYNIRNVDAISKEKINDDLIEEQTFEVQKVRSKILGSIEERRHVWRTKEELINKLNAIFVYIRVKYPEYSQTTVWEELLKDLQMRDEDKRKLLEILVDENIKDKKDEITRQLNNSKFILDLVRTHQTMIRNFDYLSVDYRRRSNVSTPLLEDDLF